MLSVIMCLLVRLQLTSLLLFAYISAPTSSNDIKSIETLTKETGYTIETHEIETEDHYLLTYHRVPRGLNGDKGGGRKPLLFVSGIFLCSYPFLNSNKDLPLALADQGYDVWLANYRGNYYSRKHKSLDPDKDKQFWNYTLTDMGTKDLAAAIDYILDKTGQPQVVYVGGSMGTTMFWMLGATRPEYMSKVTLMVAIAPVARTNLDGHTRPFRFLLITSYLALLKNLNIREIMMYNDEYRMKIRSFCTDQEWLHLRCRISLSLVRLLMVGLTVEQFIKLLHVPSSSVPLSILQHYLQMGKTQKFQKFDYGEKYNKVIYKSNTPPELSIKKITCPVYLIHSKIDDVATEEDVKWLNEQLPSKPAQIIKNLDDFNHMDFFLHKDVYSRLTQPLVEFLKYKL